MFKYNLGDNDRATRVFFVQHPREQGEWCNQNPERSEVFGVIIRPAPEHRPVIIPIITRNSEFRAASQWTAAAAIFFWEVQRTPPLCFL